MAFKVHLPSALGTTFVLLLGMSFEVKAQAPEHRQLPVFTCPFSTSSSDLKLEPEPGVTAWIWVENDPELMRRLWPLKQPDLRNEFENLKRRIGRASTNYYKGGNTQAATDALIELKRRFILTFEVLRNHDWATWEDIDYAFSILATEPTAVRCVQVDLRAQRSAPSRIQEAFKVIEKKGCESGGFKPVSDGGVVLGLLEAQPLKDEIEVEKGQHLSIVRKFSPLTNERLPDSKLEYEIGVGVQPDNLPPDFLSVTPLQKSPYQKIIENGQAVEKQWAFEIVPGPKFKPTALTLAAGLDKYTYDDQGKRVFIPPEAGVRVPFDLVSLKLTPPGPSIWETGLKRIKDVGEALFGKVGIFPVLYLIYRFIRRIWKRKQAGKPGASPSLPGSGTAPTGAAGVA